MGNKTAKVSILFLLNFLGLVCSSNGGDIVVYWGQDESEGTLSETCNSGLYKIVNIAFLAKFGGGRQPEINLAGSLRPCIKRLQKFESKDIKNCQKRGIKDKTIGWCCVGWSGFWLWAWWRRSLLRCAAPQCPFPDQHQNGAVPTGLFDFVWVQFYNNGPCQFESTDPTKFQKSWNQWVLSIRSRKIYVGLPASPSPATAVSGFVPTRTLITQVWGSNALG